MSDTKPAKQKIGGLGRGLGALLGENDTTQPGPGQTDYTTPQIAEIVSSINEIKLEHISTNPFQPREYFDAEALEELAQSIKLQGIIQPITVRKLADNEYQLISGERRLQASKIAGLETIPAYIRTANDQQMLEMGLIENIQRENLNAIEIAFSYQRLMVECDLRQEDLGDRVGKKRSTVNNYLRLLKLPPEIQSAVKDARLSMGHARALINVQHIEDQLSIFRQVLTQDLSVRRTEELVRELGEPKEKAPRRNGSVSDVELQKIQTKLTTHFGTRVNIKNGPDYKGEIRIPYISLGELNRILELIDA